MSTDIKITLNNGKFLVWDLESVKLLREKRILCKFVGCTTTQPNQCSLSTFPCVLSNNAVKLLFEHKLASFYEFVPTTNINIAVNKANYEQYKARMLISEQEKLVAKRQHEMEKRGIELTEERLSKIKKIDESNLEIPFERFHNQSISAFDWQKIADSAFVNLIEIDGSEYKVFEDLWKKDFFVNSGSKFGATFLVYRDDPLLYHAEYAIRVVPSIQDTISDETFQNNDINAFHRLCHSAHKTPVFAVVNSPTIEYFTVPTRELIDSESIYDKLTKISLASSVDSIQTKYLKLESLSH